MSYGPNGEFTRIPRELQMQARNRAIARWVRKNPDKAKETLREGKVSDEDLKVFVNALVRK